MEQKKYLSDVAIIRVVLIVLLVFYHAFLVYSGGWKLSGNFPFIKTYWWMDRLSYAFLLETFVFISGYVLGFQVRTNGENIIEFLGLLRAKFKRLIVPSVFFSFFYILLFGDISQPIIDTCRGVISGTGHMWFLPMLFWCFISLGIIERLRINPKYVIPLLFLCSICSFILIPLQLNKAMYYMIFFYAGFFLQRRNLDFAKFLKTRYAIAFVVSFLIVFPLLTMFRKNIGDVLSNGGGCPKSI